LMLAVESDISVISATFLMSSNTLITFKPENTLILSRTKLQFELLNYSTYHKPKYVTAASRIHQYDISISTEQPCTIHIVSCRQGRVCVCVRACIAAGWFLGLVLQSILPSLIFTSVFTLTSLLSLSLSLCMCLLIDLVPVIGCSIEACALHVHACVCAHVTQLLAGPVPAL